ncbi:MAG: hypothetical protein JXA25_09065 [Anaerolineales bacterium]|nr:hypothetical protein [Anaerolineales bacterium]
MERNNQTDQNQDRPRSATRVIAGTIGVLFGIAGIDHGLFEFLQGNKRTPGLVIQAIGPEQRFWVEGTEEAFTIIPNFMISGILAMLLGAAVIIWSIWFLQRPKGTTVFLILFILLFLFGGGIGQLAFFIPAWAFATRMDKRLVWWRKVLPRRAWPVLSRLWLPILILSTTMMVVGLEMAIFGWMPGLTDPAQIQNTSMSLVFTSALLNILAFIAGFGHELERMETTGGYKPAGVLQSDKRFSGLTVQ